MSERETNYGFGTPHGFRTPHRYPSRTSGVIDMSNLSLSLYPTGAAWKFGVDSYYQKTILAINNSFLRANGYGVNVIDSLLPDNENFNDDDLSLLEFLYGIFPVGDFENRKNILVNRLAYYKRSYSRQSVEYLQHIIDLHGYNAKIYENKKPYISPSEIMENGIVQNQHSPFLQHGPSTQHGNSNYSVIANESNEESFSFGGDVNLWATFFIASKESLYLPATIPPNEIVDFKKLILKVKPAHLVAFLFV